MNDVRNNVRKEERVDKNVVSCQALVCALSVLTATFNVECITCIFFSFIESTSVIIIVNFSVHIFVEIFVCLNTHFLTLKMCLVLSA